MQLGVQLYIASPSMGQIELFIYLLRIIINYSKPYSFLQIIYIT